MGVHSGFTEQQLDEFSYCFFKDCLKELGIKLQYDGVVPIIGNSFAKDANEIINKFNPINRDDDETSTPKTHKMTLEAFKNIMAQHK